MSASQINLICWLTPSQPDYKYKNQWVIMIILPGIVSQAEKGILFVTKILIWLICFH